MEAKRWGAWLLLAGAGLVLKASEPVPPSAPYGAAGEGQHLARPSGVGVAAPPGRPALPLPGRGAEPRAPDPVVLQVEKVWNAGRGAWDLALAWSGGSAPYRISRCADPAFERGPETVAEGLAGFSATLSEQQGLSLECFAVTEGEGVSPAAEAVGYDPLPSPEPPVLSATGLWWGDTVALQSNYLDLDPGANLLSFGGREAPASAVADGGQGFAVAADFVIPDDGRGAYAFVSAGGRRPAEAPFLELVPRGLPPYTNLRAVVYAKQTGRVWVAADGRVDEIDLFQHDPVVVRTYTGYGKPYLSRVTNGGTLLVVDGVAGVSQVDEIDVQTGSVAKFADTHAGTFTRNVLPLGIAADPDGSAVYLADGISGPGAGRLVKIPRNNASAIRDAYGNWTAWSFPDPCGMEVGLSHKVYAASQTWIGSCPSAAVTNLETYTDLPALSLEVDRDVSQTGYDRYYWYSDPGGCMAYNRNTLANGPFAPSNLGAAVFASAGRLSVQKLWAYAVEGEAPLDVILNNGGRDAPYRTDKQVADGLLRLWVRGGTACP